MALATPAAAVPPDRTVTATPEAPATWSGPVVAQADNVGFDPVAAGPCGKDPGNYCDITLVNVVPGDFYSTSGGGVEFSTGNAPGQDIDVFVYESNAAGDVGEFVGASAGFTADERVSVVNATGYYLVYAVYFTVRNSGYDGRAEFFRRKLIPSDVDDPPGLQDTLASNPALGYRSHSESHIAQSPKDPDILVAASKEYNLDRDSLAEYNFKVGTYVSFDRGRSWTDLGQTNVCPQGQAPPSTWPLNNTCYPADDPNREGTGAEDADDPRPGGDFGEEYTTSDPWVDFDSAGNAYFMVLDAPPFSSGNGWGMSFHRWESPSMQDVRRGRTWSNRIPINAYETPGEQAATLDDKNTFAVNTAGNRRASDRKADIIVACWGQNFDLVQSARQAIVCERSTDGGRSWPDEPTRLSPLLDPDPGFGPFVIGVHVVADTRDPNTFYAVWLDTLIGFLEPPFGKSAYWFTKSTDGGKTWEDARIIQRIQQIASIFPQQSFRNLSLPIMAVGPRGELYVTYPEYRPAPFPASDQDGLSSDIMMTASLDGGASWSAPKKVDKDLTNADQFQQYIRVTPSGQLNVSFFDRRLDQPEPPAHPGNFFIDTWLARSNDGGATWRETRLSHDSWDPSINPPISPSGEFIGDYQGLVADNCFAIPFVNDTHLANDPARDPEFDHGFPRSPFQEVFSWRVPNNRAFGGDPRACRREGGPRPEPKPERPAERIRILSDRVHVEPGGFVPVRLRCPNRAPRACAGELDLRGFGRLGDLGHTHFRIQRGTTAEVTIRLSRDDFRTIKERRRVEVLARVVPDDRRVVAHNTRKLLTLVWRPARVSRLSSADRHAALDARIITEGDAIARKYGR